MKLKRILPLILIRFPDKVHSTIGQATEPAGTMPEIKIQVAKK